MLQPTLFTWVLVVFGAVTLAPLVLAQLTILVRPQGQKARDILVAKGEDWRDKTHFRSALGYAWADCRASWVSRKVIVYSAGIWEAAAIHARLRVCRGWMTRWR